MATLRFASRGTIRAYPSFRNRVFSTTVELTTDTDVVTPQKASTPRYDDVRLPSAEDRRAPQTVQSALDLLTTNRKTKKPKFDESLEIAIATTLEVRKPNQTVRYALDLPHGTGASSERWRSSRRRRFPTTSSRTTLSFGAERSSSRSSRPPCR